MNTLALPSVSDHDIHHSARKRLFDITFSLLVLLLGAPLYLVLTLLVRTTSRGPAIYGHERVGRGGKTFRCYKFRSMYVDADARLQKLLREDDALAAEWEATQKLKRDPRVTPLGRFLRKTSLDELPQFWNVLVGELSVVGPRPVVDEEVYRHIGQRAAVIWRVRPGITGPWQISGRSDIVDYQRRIALDEGYVENWSFWTDCKIVLLTIPAVLFSRGAY